MFEGESQSGVTSFVWEFFIRSADKNAQCQKCSMTLKCAGGSTSSLLRHLKTKHLIEKRE